MLIGSVDNGRTAQAEFPFYIGRVGVREMPEGVEFGYFGDIPTGIPAVGTVDGVAFRVHSYKARDADDVGLTRSGVPKLRAVTLFAVPDINGQI